MQAHLEALGQALAALLPGSGVPLALDGAAYALFFVLVLALSALLGQRPRVRTLLVLLASIWFFAHFSGVWVLLPIGTILLDGWVARRMATTQRRTPWLVLSLSVNLLMLGTFKYATFFLGGLEGILGVPGLDGAEGPLAALVAPVGLSFLVFRSLSYVLDVHREWLDEPERDPLRHLAYVLFFPTLLAGPISRADEVLPELARPYTLSREQAGRALFLFCKGLIKKVVIADVLALNFVDRVFDAPGAFTGLENLLAAIAYGFQLYADFSGYTDLALASALALGFTLEGNFNRPFAARSVGEFWRRWHTTLSRWFNDYVFTPLSLTWRGAGRWGAVAAAILTFLLSGLWHGAGWTFILWGLAHGLAIGVETALLPLRQRLSRNLAAWYYTPLSVALCFAFLTFTFVLFRAPNLESASLMFERIGAGVDLSLLPQWAELYPSTALTLLAAVLLHALPLRLSDWAARRLAALPWWVQGLLLALVVLLVDQARTAQMQPFLYLQF